MIKLRVDRRDQHAHEYGQVSTFTEESNFSTGVPQTKEAVGGIYCTALSACKVGTSQTKNDYDVDSEWANTPHNDSGADPRDSMGAMIKNGLKRIKDGVIDKIWNGYFRADTGPMDAFDNTRSAMTVSQSSATVASPWYRGFNQCVPGEVMPDPDVVSSNHDWVVLDWKLVNGVTMFLIDAHLGYTLFMPREVYNAVLGKFGSMSLIPSTQAIDKARTRSTIQWLIDKLSNMILLLQSILISLKQ